VTLFSEPLSCGRDRVPRGGQVVVSAIWNTRKARGCDVAGWEFWIETGEERMGQLL
jgi:hypothetical protein